jgi:hypothetical protein
MEPITTLTKQGIDWFHGRELFDGIGGEPMAVGRRESMPWSGSELFQSRAAAAYTPSEQTFSMVIQRRLEALLRGDMNTLPLLRRYHREPNRLGVPRTPDRIDRRELRLPVVEEIVTALLQFLHAGTGAAGGPIAQSREEERLVERQTFTTRFPHIVIERIDRYDPESRDLLETEWVVKRFQNQRADVRLNRSLDAANLGIELIKMVLKR